MSGGDEARTAVLVRRAFALLAIAAAVGLLVVWILSWTLLSHSDRYGRVDIPGSAVLHLPQGEIEVAFRTLTPTTNGGGGALNVPPLSLGVHPANGKGPDPEVDEDFGTTASVNGDAHVRVWTVQIEREGNYRVVSDGEVGGYINPQLTFGDEDSVGDVLLWLAILAGASAVAAIGAHLVVRRSRAESKAP